MGTRSLVLGLAVAGVLTSSCASTARDTLVDIYNDDAESASFDETCQIEARTLKAATEAFYATNGTMPTSTADLVPTYLRETPDAWSFDPTAASAFSPTVGGRCDGVELDRRTPASVGQSAVDVIESGADAGCTTDKRQVETALETHFAVNGYDAMTMGELLAYGVEDELNRWTLQIPIDATTTVPVVVPIVGGPCDG